MRREHWLPWALLIALVGAGCEQVGGVLQFDDDDADDDDVDDDDDVTGDDDTTDDDDSADDDDSGDDDDTTEPPPAVTVTTPIELPETALGCTETGGGTVINGTAETVTVDGIALDDDDGGVWTLRFDDEPPWTLAPDETRGFAVEFAPGRLGSHEAQLTVTTDHPDFGELGAELRGDGIADDDWMEAFVVDEVTDVDVLWVVDNSCSMEPYQDQLSAMAGAFVGFLDDAGIDYQVGVVTTDDGQLQGAVPILDPGTPDVADTFAATVQVGTGGSGSEQPLWFGLQAVTPPLAGPGGPNDGLLRPAAGLAVVLLTDEDDQSPEVPMYYVDALQDLKPDPSLVTINAIHPSDVGCQGAFGWVNAAPRIAATVLASSGAEIPICDEDWMPALTPIPDQVLGPQLVYELTFEPMPLSIEVSVDGTPLTEGWSHDAARNALVFEVDAVPPVGSEILVYYVEPADEC